MMASAIGFGDHLRRWRQRRRLSQLELALDAEISTRHLSFLETGRAAPSREMVLRLARRLEAPLRERNQMLTAAGFAPTYPHRRLDDPSLAAARRAVDLVLTGHDPFPALAVDRYWNLVAANKAVAGVLAQVSPALLGRDANVMRIALHPQGLAPHIHNLAEWRAHLLERLDQQITASGDLALTTLRDELAAYPVPASDETAADLGGVAVPLKLAVGDAVLSLISTTTVFGTATEVTLSELTLETFFPADAKTLATLQAMAASRP